MTHLLQALRVSENRRFLVQEDGSPFFWLGDTAWELFHKLNLEEADLYLNNRSKNKFNVVQAVALAELDGSDAVNAYGRRPLKRNAEGEYDPTLPDTDGDNHYWSHVDAIVDRAASYGIYVALLPTWGDKYNKLWGIGPVVFNEANAKVFGQWLGERYKDKPNIIWVLGGDRPLHTIQHFAINQAIAEGLRDGDGGTHLRTFHPAGGILPRGDFHEEPWLISILIQSDIDDLIRSNYRNVSEDYNRTPVKPTIHWEPCYEDHPINFKPDNGYFDRSGRPSWGYYAVFAGAFGHTYGHHSIWSMTAEPKDYFIMHWKEALDRPGAAQVRYVRELIESRSDLTGCPTKA